MAEAFANKFAAHRGPSVLVLSANPEEGARINPLAVEALRNPASRWKASARPVRPGGDAASCDFTMDCGFDASDGGLPGYQVVKRLCSEECREDSLFMAVSGYG